MLAASGAFTSRKLQRQAMRAGRRVGGGTGGGARNTTGRVRALRRTRSAQVHKINLFCRKSGKFRYKNIFVVNGSYEN